MRAGAEVYREVAERCSAYDKSERKSCFCNVADGEKSCLNFVRTANIEILISVL